MERFAFLDLADMVLIPPGNTWFHINTIQQAEWFPVKVASLD
ncbi:hypothetical protein C2W64_00729 [Brevibacillus laterosporus]|nr:hypothetical protein C2W64_00729 [Brevibacillus laterosporus]